jgi:hypothetical protein
MPPKNIEKNKMARKIILGDLSFDKILWDTVQLESQIRNKNNSTCPPPAELVPTIMINNCIELKPIKSNKKMKALIGPQRQQ